MGLMGPDGQQEREAQPLMRVSADADGTSYWLWCPACDDAVRISGPNLLRTGWDWNESLTAPTFSPSLLTEGHKLASGLMVGTRCHAFITDGVWRFLDDCTHDHAGQSMPMVPLPEWLAS